MITISDLQQLTKSWQERLGDTSQPLPYKDALNDCLYELNQLINHAIEEELDYQDMLDSWEADAYLSTMEAHEHIA